MIVLLNSSATQSVFVLQSEFPHGGTGSTNMFVEDMHNILILSGVVARAFSDGRIIFFPTRVKDIKEHKKGKLSVSDLV